MSRLKFLSHPFKQHTITCLCFTFIPVLFFENRYFLPLQTHFLSKKEVAEMSDSESDEELTNESRLGLCLAFT